MNSFTDNEEGMHENIPGKNENPFRVPDGYFEKLSGEIMHKIESLPDLSKSPSVNPFEVPDGYFEKLPVSISDRISKEKSGIAGWLGSLARPRFAIPVTLAVIIIAAGIYYFRSTNSFDKSTQLITVTDIENSLYIGSMDEELLVEALSIEYDTASDQSLEEYLIDNNIDPSQIENRL